MRGDAGGAIYRDLILGHYAEADLQRIVGDPRHVDALKQSILSFRDHVFAIAMINKGDDKFEGATFATLRDANKGLQAAAKDFEAWIVECRSRIQETTRELGAAK